MCCMIGRAFISAGKTGSCPGCGEPLIGPEQSGAEQEKS